jgi:hypothetical protein
MFLKRIFFIFLCIAFSLHPNDPDLESLEDSVVTPWFTGPLLAPTGTVVPSGNFAIYPYIYYIVDSNIYDAKWEKKSQPKFYTLSSQVFGYFGLTSWMDLEIIAQMSYQRTQGQGSAQFGDLIAGFGFQLYPVDADTWVPGVKLAILETFPTGKFSSLNPAKLSTDSSGGGTFGTGLSLILYKAYHLGGFHFLSVTLSSEYVITTPVKVNGLNAYGGGLGTNGKVHPGNIFESIASFDFSFSRNWAASLDTVWHHVDRAIFSGESGLDKNGDPVVFSNPSSELFSLAPALEYNFSDALGLSCGCWFSVLGRNAADFISGVAELYCSF